MRTLKTRFEVAGDLHRLTLTQMRSAIGDMRGKRLLDIGCHDARFSGLMKNEGVSAFGIDIDPFQFGGQAIADARMIPFKDNSFDLITMISVDDLMRKDEFYMALTEINRVARNGAWFVKSAGDVMNGSPRNWEAMIKHAISIFQIRKGE